MVQHVRTSFVCHLALLPSFVDTIQRHGVVHPLDEAHAGAQRSDAEGLGEELPPRSAGIRL